MCREPEKNVYPSHPCFQLIRDSKNELSGGITRHMLTYKKVMSFADFEKKAAAATAGVAPVAVPLPK